MPTHAERRLVPYRPDQLYGLVADVAKYPQFLPWCIASRVRSRVGNVLHADLTIGFGPFRESFGSQVTLQPHSRIDVVYEKGPFRYLNNYWVFEPDPGGCKVDFFVDFEFNSRILQAAIGVVFQQAVRRMVNAFEIRARAVYGPPLATASSAPIPARG